MDRLRNLGFVIKDISRLYARLFEQQAHELHVSLTDCKVLIYLQRNEGISQIRLSELTGIEPMSLVRILDRMERDGWIERRPHPTDRRARQLYLLPKAHPTLEQLWKLSDETRARALLGLDVAERNQLLGLLERVHRNLLEAKLDGEPVADSARGTARGFAPSPASNPTPNPTPNPASNPVASSAPGKGPSKSSRAARKTQV